VENKKSAIIFGATGLIGNFLLLHLLDDDRYGEVHVYGRKPVGFTHAKLEEHIIDFNRLDDYRAAIKADEVFCCLGSTIKKAGTRENFRRVDFEWVRWCAVAAAENKVPAFIVVSSLGANAGSNNFYYRTKGEMEKAVSALNFEKYVIVRPSILLGSRNEFRPGEVLGKIGMQVFSFLLPKRIKPVHGETVARAMIVFANDAGANGVKENEVIRRAGKRIG
jgi:uncharacterized protein YbjT (DUF2867 family)